nr:PREDICTED: uncharacterized protein LOC107078562 isoform X1 [Lepisosteus oculatus]
MFKRKQGQFGPQINDLPTTQIKNTISDVSVLNLRLPVTNGTDLKTPGFHLSQSNGERDKARVTAGRSLLKSQVKREHAEVKSQPQEAIQKESENVLPRRPVKLAPLEVNKDVKKSQQQKIKEIEQEAAIAAKKVEVMGTESNLQGMKQHAKTGLEKTVLNISHDSFRETAIPQTRLKKPCSVPERHSDHFQGSNCGIRRETSLKKNTFPCKPLVPMSSSQKSKALVSIARGNCSGNPDFFQGSAVGHLRLRKGKDFEVDQRKSKMSTLAGLSDDDGKPPQRTNTKKQLCSTEGR